MTWEKQDKKQGPIVYTHLLPIASWYGSRQKNNSYRSSFTSLWLLIRRPIIDKNDENDNDQLTWRRRERQRIKRSWQRHTHQKKKEDHRKNFNCLNLKKTPFIFEVILLLQGNLEAPLAFFWWLILILKLEIIQVLY